MRYAPSERGEYEAIIKLNKLTFENALASGMIDSIVYYGAQFGESLTNAGRELEAERLMQPLIAQYAQQANLEDRGWLFLHWATANQYLHRDKTAVKGFNDALSIAKTNGFEQLEHYTLHHFGRFLVERGKLSKAKAAFEQALQIRLMLNEKRAVNTRMALDSICVLQQSKKAP